MNFQPIISRKELAAACGISPRTLQAKFGKHLERARSKALIKPVIYFRREAERILTSVGALAANDEPPRRG